MSDPFGEKRGVFQYGALGERLRVVALELGAEEDDDDDDDDDDDEEEENDDDDDGNVEEKTAV